MVKIGVVVFCFLLLGYLSMIGSTPVVIDPLDDVEYSGGKLEFEIDIPSRFSGDGSRLYVDVDNKDWMGYFPAEFYSHRIQFSDVVDIVVFDDYIYICDGNFGFLIYDISSRISPVFVSNPYTLEVTSVFVEGDLSLLQTPDLLIVWNTSDKANPTMLDSISDDKKYVYVEGDYAFSSSSGNCFGFHTYDISNPQSISLIDNVNPGSCIIAYRVAVLDDTVYMCTMMSGLYIYDISTKSSAELMSIFELSQGCIDIKVHEDLLYIATCCVDEYDFVILNATNNRTHPSVVVESVLSISAHRSVAILYIDDMVYTSVYGINQWKLADVSDPSIPVYEGKISTKSVSIAVARNGINSIAYVAGEYYGVGMYNVSVMNNIYFSGSFLRDGGCVDVSLRNDGSFVVIGYELGYRIYDIQDFENPHEVFNHFFSTYSIKFTPDGDYLVIGTTYSLSIYDVRGAKITNPTYVEAFTSLPRLNSISFHPKNPNIVYATTRPIGAPTAGFLIFDITNKNEIILKSENYLPDWGSEDEIYLFRVFPSNESIGFLAADLGLFIFDVSNSSTPIIVGNYSSYDEFVVLDVFVNFNTRLAYLGCGNGIHVLDISEIGEPYLVTIMYTNSQFKSVEGHQFSDDLLQVTISNEYVIKLLNVSDPFNPQVLYSKAFDTAVVPFTDVGISMAGNIVAVANGIYGFTLLMGDKLLFEGRNSTFTMLCNTTYLYIEVSALVRDKSGEITDEFDLGCFVQCYGKHFASEEVCNFQNGTCTSRNNCTCNVDYFGDECDNWLCGGVSRHISSSVCSGHGQCLLPDYCECYMNYSPGGGVGQICQDWDCYGVANDDPSVCNYLNGTCSSYNNCTCNGGYSENECDHWECGGYSHDDFRVCSGRGNCLFPDFCQCDTNYSPTGQDNFCDMWSCYTKQRIDSSVCNFQNGTCSSHDNCTCNDGYSGSECDYWECDGYAHDDFRACSGHGNCLFPDFCQCDTNYVPEGLGNYCHLWDCHGTQNDDPSVCNYLNGTCSSYNNCTCNIGYNGIECDYWECDGVAFNDPHRVCSGHGNCLYPDYCQCDTNYSPEGQGNKCNIWSCQGTQNDDPSVCNFLNGTCASFDNCSCNDGYSGSQCDYWECDGIVFVDPHRVCSGHGNCLYPDFCQCDANYRPEGQGNYCHLWDCHETQNDDFNVCNYLNGTCSSFNNCTCNDGYSGSECDYWECDGYAHDDFRACSGHGNCLFPDFCQCDTNYVPEGLGNYCHLWDCHGTPNDDPSVCNYLNGTCSSYNNCTCNIGYNGIECEIWHCDEVRMDNSTVCSSHGNCLFPDFCQCDVNYSPGGGGGQICQDWDCYLTLNHDPSVCNYLNGTCVSYNNCSCKEGYYGDECNLWDCQSISKTLSTSCAGHGTCILPDTCDCDDNYYPGGLGGFCQDFECYGTDRNLPSVCSTLVRGKCSSYNNCTCNPGYYGVTCDFWKCDGIIFNDSSSVCSSHGDCVEPDNCTCYPNYFPSGSYSYCDNWECDSILKESHLVCSGHGECVSPDNCDCDSNYYFSGPGSFCQFHKCYGTEWTEPKVCNFGNGTCTSHDNCTCNVRYFGDECDIWECDGELFYDHIDVCSGRGACVRPDMCLCHSEDISGETCNSWNCFGVERSEFVSVCAGHGECIDPDTCVCNSDTYQGDECNLWMCFNKSVFDVGVCSSNGNCVDEDICGCRNGYSGSECEVYFCGELRSTDPKVCSEHGTCTGYQKCTCDEGYSGTFCDEWSCGYVYTSEKSCGGNGECVGPGECECSSGYSGDLCENVEYIKAVVAPLLSVIAVTFLIFSMICCWICVMGICCCSCVCVLFLIVGGVVVTRQALGMKRFKKLKNFDILMKEQEMEEDDSIAHLRIRSEFFEVNYDEIEVEKIIGEGGSNAIVFLSRWKGQVVAFKCFKTRMVCQNQDKFTEFEREVEILASLSHPNIIRFFGASLKPPRVGILMEYCSNGDLFQFLTNFKKENGGRSYPYLGKMRMILEVSSSLDYLHERKIIHRDLKCENVLVNDQEMCKVMDFGLSRAVERASVQKTMRIGTNIYMAPEVVSTGIYTEKCDVFSFGIMMWVVFCEDDQPYGADDFNIEFSVSADPHFRPSLKKLRDELTDSRFSWIEEVITSCWSHLPSERCAFSEIIEWVTEGLKGRKTGEEGNRMKRTCVDLSLYKTIRELEGEIRSSKKKLKLEMKKRSKLKQKIANKNWGNLRESVLKGLNKRSVEDKAAEELFAIQSEDDDIFADFEIGLEIPTEKRRSKDVVDIFADFEVGLEIPSKERGNDDKNDDDAFGDWEMMMFSKDAKLSTSKTNTASSTFSDDLEEEKLSEEILESDSGVESSDDMKEKEHIIVEEEELEEEILSSEV